MKQVPFFSFFLTKLDQVRQLWIVRPEDFDAEAMLAASRKGRLCVDITNDKAAIEWLLKKRKCEALAYVSAIEEYVAPEWEPYIKALWTTLLNDPLFTPQLLLQKGKHQGQLNKYLLTNIVSRMKEQGIYRCGNFIELHKKMEGVDKKNSIYKCAGEYSLEWEQRQRLHELMKSFGKSLK